MHHSVAALALPLRARIGELSGHGWALDRLEGLLVRGDADTTERTEDGVGK